ncbi:unnamed protein product [Closterium sp. NIES-54]
MYKDSKAENEAKIGMRFGEVKSSGLEHVELPLELSSSSTTTRQSSLVNGGEEAKNAEEEEEEVQQVSECAPTLPSRTTSAPRIRVTPQQRQGLHVPAAEEEGRGKRRIQAPNRLTHDALGKPAKSALAGVALIVGDDKESDYEECAFAFFSPVEMPGEPATLKEALESSDAEDWKNAMESELKSIEENGTWKLVELPEGRKAITSKWLFKIKSDADGKIERYKSRLVAKGYQQKEKSDYEECAFAFFSPVEMPGEPATLKEALESSDAEDWKNAMESEPKSIEENGTWKLVELPEGRKAITSKWLFKIKSDADGKIERYKSRLVAKGYQQKEKEIGFTPSSADHSLFMLGEGEQRSFMVVYVDDILIFSPSSDLVKEVMLKLQDKFKCKALGDVSFYLGLHIERDVEKRCMRVHQRKYLEALAANFGQSEGHVATPFPSGFKCVKGPEEESVGEEERRRFHSLVGSLMYAAVNTQLDVAFATGQLARVVQCPNEEQVAAGMRVAKYLDQTTTVGLQYSAAAQRRQKGADSVEPGHLFLTAFSDASFASEPEDMTSVGGFICCVGGGPTAWESKKQVDQALSSVESEYMALFRAVREIVWQRRLLDELGEEQQGPTPLYCDSHGAISLAKNPVLHGLTKHMRVKWHWTRSMVAAGEVELHYVKTTRQPADMMTKRLVEQQHWKSYCDYNKGDPDAPDIPTLRSYVEAIMDPYSSQWQTAMDAEMASWKSTSTYVDEVPRWNVDFQGEAVAGFSACLQGSFRCTRLHLHEEIWLRRPPGFTGSFPAGTQWSLRWPVYGLHEAPREWHDTLRTTLAALGFAPLTANPSLYLHTDTSLPPFYVLVYLGLQITRDRALRTITLTQSHMVHQVLQYFGFWYSSPQSSPLPTGHSLSAPPSDESLEPSGAYLELVGCLMYLMTCTRPELAYPLSILSCYVAPGRHLPEHWEAAKRVLRYLCSTSGMGLVLG